MISKHSKNKIEVSTNPSKDRVTNKTSRGMGALRTKNLKNRRREPFTISPGSRLTTV